MFKWLNKKPIRAQQRRLDSLYMDLAVRVGQQSKDNKYKVGAILVDSSYEDVISFGYNGTPRGSNNETRDKEGNTLRTVVHAETNAICKAARRGKTTDNAILYTTISPCFECARYIIQAGISRCVYMDVYCSKSISFLKSNNIIIERL